MTLVEGKLQAAGCSPALALLLETLVPRGETHQRLEAARSSSVRCRASVEKVRHSQILFCSSSAARFTDSRIRPIWFLGLLASTATQSPHESDQRKTLAPNILLRSDRDEIANPQRQTPNPPICQRNDVNR